MAIAQADISEGAEALKLQIAELEKQVKLLTEELATEKKKADSANKTKTEFLTNISHEIRTPMNGIIGMVELLRKTNLDAEQKENIDILTSSASSLLQIINDVLDISKIESGKLALQKTIFSPAQIFKEVDDLFRPELENKNLYLKLELDKSVEQFALGDAARIKQILSNLVSNAMKFTNQGGITIKSNLLGKTLHTSVIDTGSGIAPEKVEQIFDKFVQGDASVSRKFGGTGLGLAITTELVKLMNGKVWVESKLGDGSIFSFFILLG